MKGISENEIRIVSALEFRKKYFFRSADIEKFVTGKTQRYNIIKNLLKKKRIIKLNRTKYYLIPIKARKGSWSEHPFIIADEVCDGKNYFIGGWAAANYWNLTDQIPMKIDIYTTRRQGKTKVLNTKIIFHRTTNKKIKESATTKKLENHKFSILKRTKAKKWMKSKE